MHATMAQRAPIQQRNQHQRQSEDQITKMIDGDNEINVRQANAIIGE